jgi:hypothetical protein
MLKQGTRFSQNPKMLFHKEGNGAYLYDPDSGTLKYINAVGSFLYELCDAHHPIEQMITRIAGEYQDVPIAQIESDVECFLTDLLGMDFVRRAP